MPFNLRIVKRCPFCVGSRGIMRIDPAVIAMMAHTVWEEKEWAAILKGTRSEDGLEVTVEDIVLPEKQSRSGSRVIVEKELIPDDAIGVVHSHADMVARFSPQDEDDLNRKFFSSLVISQRIGGDLEFSLLGFSYEAIGTFRMPCGKWGRCHFGIVPMGVQKEDWPVDYWMDEPAVVPWTVGMDKDKKPVEMIKLEDCSARETGEEVGKWHYVAKGKCGLKETEARMKERVFGLDESLTKDLPPAEAAQVYQYPPSLPGPGSRTLGPAIWTSGSYGTGGKNGAKLAKAEKKIIRAAIREAKTDQEFMRWAAGDDRRWAYYTAVRQEFYNKAVEDAHKEHLDAIGEELEAEYVS